MKILKNSFFSRVPRITQPKKTHRQNDYCGHPFRVSGFFYFNLSSRIGPIFFSNGTFSTHCLYQQGWVSKDFFFKDPLKTSLFNIFYISGFSIKFHKNLRAFTKFNLDKHTPNVSSGFVLVYYCQKIYFLNIF